jgi:hypothetical protein
MRALALLLILILGCARPGSSRYMVRDMNPDPPTAPPGKAMIVFVCEEAGAQPFTILDDQGRFVGQVPNQGYLQHVTDPGRYRYLLWAENTAALDAEVAAGKTYFVLVDVRMGWWSARGHLLAIKPGSEEWKEIDEWLARTWEWDQDPALARKWEEDKREGIENQIQRGREIWAKYGAEEKAERTLRPEDGRSR